MKNSFSMGRFVILLCSISGSFLSADSFQFIRLQDKERMQAEHTIKEYADGRIVSGKSTVDTAELIYSHSSRVFYKLVIDDYEQRIQRILDKGNIPRRIYFLSSDADSGYHFLDERERFVREKGSYAIFTSAPNPTIIGALIDSIFLHIPSSNSHIVSSLSVKESKEVKFLEYHFKQKKNFQSTSTQEVLIKDGKELKTVDETIRSFIESSTIGLKFSFIERESEFSEFSKNEFVRGEKNRSIRREGSEINFLRELLEKIYRSEDIGVRIAHFEDEKSYVVQLSIRKEKVNQIIKLTK